MNLPCIGETKTIIPLYALEIIKEKGVPLSKSETIINKLKHIISQEKSKLKKKIIEAGKSILDILTIVGINLAEGTLLFPLGIALGLTLLPEADETQHLREVSNLPHHKLEELEEAQGLPPGTITMAGRYTNPADLLRIIGETLGRRIENIEKIREKIREIPQYRTLKELQQSFRELEDEINKIWREIEKMKKELKGVQTFKALPINNIDHLIDLINYQPESGKLIDLTDKSQELRKIIEEIIEKLEQNKALIITGPSGSGKTTLLLLTSKKLMENGYNLYYLVNPATFGAIPLSDIEGPAILIYDNLLPKNQQLANFILINRKTLPILSTARNHVLQEILDNLTQEVEKNIGINRLDIKDLKKDNIYYLSLQKEYPKILLITLLKQNNIKYSQEAIEIIIEKSKQKYIITGKTKKSEKPYYTGNLYYIIKTVEYLKRRKKRKITRKEAEKIPTGLYPIITAELLEAAGIPTPTSDEDPEILANQIIENPIQETVNPMRQCIKQQTNDGEAIDETLAFAKCLVLYLIPRVALALEGKTLKPETRREIIKALRNILKINSDIKIDPPYLRNNIPHDSHAILLTFNPLDLEALQAKLANP